MPVFNFEDTTVDLEELCPDTNYDVIVGCENVDSTPEINVISQPIGAGVTISAPTQINAGDFRFTISVDTAGSYEFEYCCRYDD